MRGLVGRRGGHYRRVGLGVGCAAGCEQHDELRRRWARIRLVLRAKDERVLILARGR
jgi:hypothetical protein